MELRSRPGGLARGRGAAPHGVLRRSQRWRGQPHGQRWRQGDSEHVNDGSLRPSALRSPLPAELAASYSASFRKRGRASHRNSDAVRGVSTRHLPQQDEPEPTIASTYAPGKIAELGVAGQTSSMHRLRWCRCGRAARSNGTPWQCRPCLKLLPSPPPFSPALLDRALRQV